MSAPDPKAVEDAIEAFAPWAAAFDVTGGPGIHLRTLLAAASAYVRAPTAPQGAEPFAWIPERDPSRIRFFPPEPQDTGSWISLYGAPQGAEIARASPKPTR